MRFRLGLVIGFGSGYYLGAKAGHERYVQLRRWVDRAKESEVVGTAADKARAAVDLGVERAKDLVDRRSAENGSDHVVGANGNGFSR